MRKALAILLLSLVPCAAPAQTAAPQQQPQEEVVRITSALVQTDVVVTDKNDRIVPDLKLSDFEVYENGKRQELKFMEFVGLDTGLRAEGERPDAALPESARAADARELSSKDVRRVIAFVVDDLTIPYADLATVRQILTDFVDNKMREGDLVAIVRVIGGKGLLQQLTSDRQLLHRAIAELNAATNPFMLYNNPGETGQTGALPTSANGGGSDSGESVNFEDLGLQDFSDPNNETQRLFRGMFSLSTADFVIDSMKELPGRKTMVLISGGIPIFEANASGSVFSNVSYLINRLSDHAARAGVAINTMDPRGLKATPGVRSFEDTPARSALGGAPDATFGRGGSGAGRADINTGPRSDISGPDSDNPFSATITGGDQHLSLSTLSNATGGVSVVNTNNFREGLDKVLGRTTGYYILAYTPSEKFDNKFRKIEVKVRRDGVKVYGHQGYFARPDASASATPTKEQTILAAVRSPLARRDVDLSANIVLKPSPATNKTALDIHMLIDARGLNFKQGEDGKYHTSFDVVGFVYDQFGRLRGGFSETASPALAPDEYQRVLASGLTYSASTELPHGGFQFRAVVREAETGNTGTLSRYLEVPDLSAGRLAMSSLFLFAADPAQPKATPAPLLAVRQVSRKQDLRYAALIYNAKSSGGKSELRSQVIISQKGKILYREPEQPVSGAGSPVTKIGQIGVGGVPPGRYVLTLVVTDPQADKKSQTVARSIDFTVVK
jgi:VWFA-related protein